MEFIFGTAHDADAPALIAPDGARVSYGELLSDMADSVPALGPGRRLVAIEAARDTGAITAYLGALSAGHVVAMLPPGDTRAWQALARDFQPDAVLWAGASEWELTSTARDSTADLHPELALLLSTSGSTGESKFVRLSRDNLIANARSIASYLELTSADRSALILPLHYCYGLSVLHSHLFAGGSLYLAPESVLADGFAEAVAARGCTNLSGVPHSYRLLAESGFREKGPDLRFMTVAGGRLDPVEVEAWRAHLAAKSGQFFVMYGQTEATARISYVPPNMLASHGDCIGVPIPEGEIALLDEAGAEISSDAQAGELCYRGPNVMLGYASSRADLAKGPEVDGLKTGDLAERLPGGLFRIVGRLKRISKISGLRISHDALEQVLARRGIEAAVTGDDKVIAALHVSGESDAAVRDALAEASGLPPLVLQVAKAEELPRLNQGKLDYPSVKRMVEAAQTATPAKSADVYSIFEETFAPQKIRPEDSFVSLGGDSLRFVQMLLSLEQIFGRLPEDWEEMQIRDLARLGRQPAGWSRIGSDLVIRVAAILLVVVHHATHWPIPGGAAAMMVLVGFGLARFQREAALEGNPGRLFSGLPRVLGPYFVILAGFAIGWGQIPWASVFLIGNFGFADPVDHNMLPYLYWFVEIFAQSVAIIFALFLIRPIRDLARDNPLIFSLGLIALGVGLRFAWAEHWDFGGRQIFTIPWNFYLFALGWAAATAQGWQQKLLIMALACLILPAAAYWGGNWIGGWVKYMIQVGVMAVLLFVPQISLPRLVFVPVLTFAAAGYHIYLFHRLLPENLPDYLGRAQSETLFITVSIIIGIACGFAAYWLQNALIRLVTQLRRPRTAFEATG